MGFCDITSAEVIAYTRQRRAEDRARRAADPKPQTIRVRINDEACHRIEQGRGLGRVLAIVRERQGRRCYLCAEPMARSAETKDHVHPRSKGGLDVRNILLACEPCNNGKGNRLPHPCERLYCEAAYIGVPIPKALLCG